MAPLIMYCYFRNECEIFSWLNFTKQEKNLSEIKKIKIKK